MGSGAVLHPDSFVDSGTVYIVSAPSDGKTFNFGCSLTLTLLYQHLYRRLNVAHKQHKFAKPRDVPIDKLYYRLLSEAPRTEIKKHWVFTENEHQVLLCVACLN